jgi:hypothetical protein
MEAVCPTEILMFVCTCFYCMLKKHMSTKEILAKQNSVAILAKFSPSLLDVSTGN